jgi:NADH-ubiquinone/plastoquinone oxidoreductase, chain 3
MLFLVFDIELVLLLPISVSLSSISTYGFIIAIIFFIILTIGFLFELSTDSISIKPSNPQILMTGNDDEKTNNNNNLTPLSTLTSVNKSTLISVNKSILTSVNKSTLISVNKSILTSVNKYTLTSVNKFNKLFIKSLSSITKYFYPIYNLLLKLYSLILRLIDKLLVLFNLLKLIDVKNISFSISRFKNNSSNTNSLSKDSDIIFDLNNQDLLSKKEVYRK